MFTSKEHLHYNLGIDAGVAAFFIDRKVPVNNSYWRGRLLYISRGTGYLFIPLFFDLQLKCGVKREIILSEEYVQLMENILNSAAMHEFEQIDFDTHITNCTKLLENNIHNKELYDDLLVYFSSEDLKSYKNLGTSSKALNRGDTFLFLLCFPDLTRELTEKIIKEWYALVPSFLLLDDIMDLRDDKEKNQENSIEDFGTGNEGVYKAIEYLRSNFKELKNINCELGEYFERTLEKKLTTPYLQSILNN